MRILHTSDWHLGKKTDDLDRLDEQRQVLEQIVNIAKEREVDMVLISGDIYDQFIPSADAENLFYKTISELARGGECAVVAIAGNHDEPKRMSNAQVFASRFGIYLIGYWDEITNSNLSKEHNIFATSVGKGYIKFETKSGEKCTVATLPWPSFYRYREQKTEDKTLMDKYAEWLKEACKEFKKGENNILCTHLSTAGVRFAEFDDEVSEYSPFATLTRDVLTGVKNMTYGALGHIHYATKVTDNTYYCGSLINTHFTNEKAIEKSVNVVEVKDGKLVSVDVVPLTCKKMRVINTKDFAQIEAFCKQYPQDYVKAVVENVKFVDFEDVKKLRAANPNLVTLSVITDEAKELAQVEIKKDLTTQEIFDKYVLNKTGKLPEKEVKELFLELMGEAVYEAD
ncbi:MAG: exonuclease SbcCD subunit D [Clostridia bacterium]|nr:exonuclease SbcCD subunit D [Clostridia bacterium]